MPSFMNNCFLSTLPIGRFYSSVILKVCSTDHWVSLRPFQILSGVSLLFTMLTFALCTKVMADKTASHKRASQESRQWHQSSSVPEVSPWIVHSHTLTVTKNTLKNVLLEPIKVINFIEP